MSRADSTRAARAHLAAAVALAFAVGATFWVPALRATGGAWPAPLDDVFIHFDFARAAASGHPGSWIAGQGYSSGETSPLYGAVLALGWLVGFRGGAMGVFAAIVAVACVATSLHALHRFAGPTWARWLAMPLMLAVGVVDWSLYSGMETALWLALATRAVLAADAARHAPPAARRASQLSLSAWGALLVWTRPESLVVAAPLAVLAARGSRSQSPWAALVRSLAGPVLATGAVMGTNAAFTGDVQSAGARLKLLSSNPFLSDVDRARELALNLFSLVWKVAADQLGPTPRFAWTIPVLALGSLVSRRTREVGAATLASAVSWALLVSINGAARYQNHRYYAPAIALVLLAACLGVLAISTTRARTFGAIAAAIVTLGAASRIPVQIAHFSAASGNVAGQQVRVGRWLRDHTPSDAIVMVGDAGAIPWASERRAVDVLGLGGYHGVPFVEAAPHGEAASAELVQRLPAAMRPTHLALYPNWFGGITSTFGREVHRETLEANIICGGPTKVVYVADWSALDGDAAPGGTLHDELDVADVISERAHGYVSPAPEGGWTTMTVRGSVFDAGRIIPEGRAEHLRVKPTPRGARIVVRVDELPAEAVVIAAGSRVALAEEPSHVKEWRALAATLPQGATELSIEAVRGTLRDHHVWIVTGR